MVFMNRLYLSFFIYLFSLSVGYANNDSLKVIYQNLNTRENIDRLNKGLLAVFESRYIPTELSAVPEDYLLYAEKSLQIAEGLNYLKGQAEALLIIGLYYWHKGLDYREKVIEPESLPYLERAAAISKNIGNVVIEIKANRAMQKIYREKGETRVSSETLVPIYELSNKMEQVEIGKNQKNVNKELIRELRKCRYFLATDFGNIYIDANEYLKSLKYFLEALVLAREENDMHKVAYSLNNVAKAYDKLARRSKAISQLEEGISIAENHKDLFCIALLYNSYGEVKFHLNETVQANYYYTQALAISNKVNNLPLKASILRNIAKIYAYNRQYPQALDAYLQAVSIYEIYAPRIQLVDMYKELSDIFLNNKDYQKALYYFKQYTDLKEQFLVEKLLKEITEIEKEKQLEEYELLKKNYALAESELKVQKAWQNITFIVAVILAIASVLLLTSFLQKQRAYKILSKQKEELKQVNKLKDKLFAVISQDLRSPLHSLRNVVALLEAENLNPQETKLISEKLNEDLGATLGLLDNLLYWARSQMQGIKKESQLINIHELIDENINLLSGNANKKGVALINNVPQNLEPAYADLNMINLVVRNLLSNAIKFTPKGGSIIFNAKLNKDDFIEVSITDTGIGISKADQERIFNTKEVLSTSEDTIGKGEGIGLGLLLCKEFIEENGGEIWVKSEIAKGSTFTFSLKTASKDKN
jgi:signal transduction histidine kinase